MKAIEDSFSMDANVLKVLTYQPQLCTLYDLRTKYCYADFLDFIEIIDTMNAINNHRASEAIKHNQQRNKKNGR